MQTAQIHAESFSLMKDTAPTTSSSVWRKRVTGLISVLLLIGIGIAAMLRTNGANDAGEGHNHEHDKASSVHSSSPSDGPSHSESKGHGEE